MPTRAQREAAEYDERRRRRDLEMMLHPERWPNWPLLPIKRWHAASYRMDLAVLKSPVPRMAALGDQPLSFIKDQNVFVPISSEIVATAPTRTPQELIDDGWLVD